MRKMSPPLKLKKLPEAMKLSPNQSKALEFVAAGCFYPCLQKEDDGWHARWRVASGESDSGIDLWADEFVRNAAVTVTSRDAENDRFPTLHDAWIAALKSETGLVVWNDVECADFSAVLDNWSRIVRCDGQARKSVAFRLQPSEDGFEIVCKAGARYESILALGLSSDIFPPLVGLRADGKGTMSVALSRSQAESFVRNYASKLRDAGYIVEGVDIGQSVTASAELLADGDGTAEDSRKATALAKIVIRVAGEEVSAEEIRFLLEQGSTMVFFRNRWIEVDRDILKAALRVLEKREHRVESPVAFALGLGRIGALEIEDLKIKGWLRGLVNELRNGGRDSSAASGEQDLAVPGLCGELRAYQRRGVQWLDFLTAHGFGAMLADDMGLGKTIQTIAWMLKLKSQDGLGKALIVAPLTLLSNWRHELARFAPSLKVYLHHGDLRHRSSGFKREVNASDVVLTSYNLLVREYQDFSEIAWSALILDEAQLVKNPDTQVSKAVRALSPRNRVAISGTPIENGIGDIWSLEEFLNPGFLGKRKEFVDRFIKPMAISVNSSAARRLRHALEPFVLRRLKSDSEIAAELGEKREIKEYCELTPIQRREYEAVLANYRANEHRHGDILALIGSLKLVCDGVETKTGRLTEKGSGKLQRLFALLEQIFANGESALVFTQYATVGKCLREELEQKFGWRFPFLYGGLTARQREREIDAFMKSPVPTAFVLSLKAGGFGLNLTKATHVIHFDRWWNPAVEDQATDRAHRIGQDKTVFVHAFITNGTLEEHVDEILERKSLIAGSIITEMEWLNAVQLSE